MDLIERYIADVARRLPARMRDDVTAELLSSLAEGLDSMTARAEAGAGRAATDSEREALAVDLLKSFGPAAALAASYRPGPQWLIGPGLYPAFLRTLRIVALAIIGVVILSAVAGAIARDRSFVDVMQRLTTGDLFSNLVSALGWVVLVFWIIELSTWRQGAAAGGASGSLDAMIPVPPARPATGSWDPRRLPRVNDPDRIARTELAVEIAIMLGLLVLFALFPESVGASVEIDGERGWIGVLGPGFLQRREWLYAGWIGVVAMDLLLVYRNRWTIATRVVDIALNGVFIVALALMAAGGGILAVDVHDMVANGWSADAAERISATVVPALDIVARVGVTIVTFFIVVHTLVRAFKLARRLAG
jgi:hypothetical protein